MTMEMIVIMNSKINAFNLILPTLQIQTATVFSILF